MEGFVSSPSASVERKKATMVKVILNPGLRRLSGKMGDWTYRWMYGKQTIMKTPDMSKVKWSKAQKEHRKRFRQAILYAHRAMADPEARAYYEKVGKKVAGSRSEWRSPIFCREEFAEEVSRPFSRGVPSARLRSRPVSPG
jgi:hypothetical protein